MQPRWSRNGKELFYVEGDRLMAVTVSTANRFSAGTSEPLFQNPHLQNLSRATSTSSCPDGQKFVLIEPLADEKPSSIHIVQNWYEEFRDREQD